jgi:hypothetical protein
MKWLVICGVILAATRAATAAGGLEDVALHFSTNTTIVWQAPTNNLPKRLWTYKRSPQVFSAVAISNGVVLAGFEKKGFPRPTTNHVVIWADQTTDGEPSPPYFALFPQMGQMSYDLGDRAPGSPMDSARDQAAVNRAWEYASRLGADLTQLVRTNAAEPGVGGVFLPRQLDGIPFFDGTEGFHVMLCKDTKIRSFCLMWPNLERDQIEATATPQEIIRCIEGNRAVLVPGDAEGNYFTQVKQVEQARRLTITRITPYYGEGMLGEEPRENEPPKYVGPVAVLGANTEFGTNVTSVRIYAPILASDVRRLLKTR